MSRHIGKLLHIFGYKITKPTKVFRDIDCKKAIEIYNANVEMATKPYCTTIMDKIKTTKSKEIFVEIDKRDDLNDIEFVSIISKIVFEMKCGGYFVDYIQNDKDKSVTLKIKLY